MKLSSEISGIALSLTQAGTLKYRAENPTCTTNPEELILTWREPFALEIRIREDGRINWYRVADGVCSGSEGWVRYQEGRNPMSDPWLVAA